eukprot:2757687-Amphidinium_carterae.1
MVIKLLAVALQQKLFGYPFSESVTIKKTIGLQSGVEWIGTAFLSGWSLLAPQTLQGLSKCQSH